MGKEIEYHCKECGFSKEVSCGGGFRSGYDEETREEVLNGDYGARPKMVAESSPDAFCSWYMAMFHCSCGNVSSKNAVVIYGRGKVLYRPSMRCDICHRKMWEIVNPPYTVPCPKCGHEMEYIPIAMYD